MPARIPCHRIDGALTDRKREGGEGLDDGRNISIPVVDLHHAEGPDKSLSEHCRFMPCRLAILIRLNRGDEAPAVVD